MSLADRIYWLHALTPIHVGAGRGEGYIDLPVIREKVTRLPFVPGSAVKGVLADLHGASGTREEKSLAARAFGRMGDGSANAGALVMTDAKLVCLPVRSYYGTFAWCTSRLILHQLSRDLALAGLPSVPIVPSSPAPGNNSLVALIPEGLTSVLVDPGGKALLEDLDFVATRSPQFSRWSETLAACLFDADDPWRDLFRERFILLPDDVLQFLAETGTEVRAHVKIDDQTGCVARGALWYEESLPAETILAGLIWADRFPGAANVDEMLTTYCSDIPCIQIGGKGSVGKGRVRCRFTRGHSG